MQGIYYPWQFSTAARSFLPVARSFLPAADSFLPVARSFLPAADSFLLALDSFSFTAHSFLPAAQSRLPGLLCSYQENLRPDNRMGKLEALSSSVCPCRESTTSSTRKDVRLSVVQEVYCSIRPDSCKLYPDRSKDKAASPRKDLGVPLVAKHH